MKRSLFVAVLLLSFTLASAQLNFGVRAGYNSSLSFNNIGDVTNGKYNLTSVQNEMWNNFQAGAFARVFFKKKVYFEPALMYSIEKKQYTISYTDLQNKNFSFDSIADIKTIDIPLLFGVKLLDLKLANIHAFAGPKLRFNAGSTPQLKDDNGNVDINKFVSGVKKANIGIEAGAGIDVLMFALDLRYNVISSMYKIEDIKNVKFDPASTFVVTLSWKIF
jgi:hypothetical protein